jgi:putative adenylate-forming enzyme
VNEKLKILSAFYAKRWTLRRLRNRNDIAQHQKRLLKQLMTHAILHFPFYARASSHDFDSWPIVDKAIMMRDFGQMNSRGLSREVAWNHAENGLKTSNSSANVNDLTIGTSTGTSGQRGLFVVSSHERALWLGSVLARCLPDFPWVKHRVAVMLATGNELYHTAGASGRLAFAFFDLKQGLESHASRLQGFAPDVLVAPPKAVRALVDAGLKLPLKHIFTGGEVLDALDAVPIETWFKLRPRSIYQATEGFLGVACEHGHIHLNEDDVLFEEEKLPGHSHHFVPVITDLRRRTQAMIRYRLNDILLKLPGPCACGSPFMALQRVEGRCDDVLRFKSTVGEKPIRIMPEVLRAIILDADRRVTDFRLVQKQTGDLHLQLPLGTSASVTRNVTSALSMNLVKLGVAANVKISTSLGIEVTHSQKLRRIRSELDQV